MMEGEIRKHIAFQFPDLSPEAQEEMIQEKLAMIQAKMAGKAAGEPSEPDLPEGCGPDAMSRWGEVMAQTCSCDFFLEETCLPEEKRPYAMAECQQKHLVNLPCAAEAAAQPVAEQPEPEEAAAPAAEVTPAPEPEQPEPEEVAAPAAEVTPAPEPEQPEPEEPAAPAAEETPAPEPEQPEPEESAAPTAPRMSPKEQMKKGNMSPAQKMAMMEGEIRKKIAFQFPDLSPEAQEEMIQEKLAMIQAKMAGKAAGEPSEP